MSDIIKHYMATMRFIDDQRLITYMRVTDSHEGVQCLLDESLVKLSREHSRSLADVTLSQRSNDDSASLPWSSPLDAQGGCSSFSGMLLHYSCRKRDKWPTTPTLCLLPCNSTSLASCGLTECRFAVVVCSRNTWIKVGVTFLFLKKLTMPTMHHWYHITASCLHPDLCLSLSWVILFLGVSVLK